MGMNLRNKQFIFDEQFDPPEDEPIIGDPIYCDGCGKPIMVGEEYIEIKNGYGDYCMECCEMEVHENE